MSSRELRQGGSECSQESSDSSSGSQPNSSRVQGKPKRADKKYMTWKFRDTVQADFSGLGSLGERRQKLIEHFRTRTSSERPLCVRSVTVFADLEQLVFEAPGETRTISISIIGYVQTKQSRTFTMTNWIKSTNWEPITGGLFSNCEFLNYLDYAESPSKSWYQFTTKCLLHILPNAYCQMLIEEHEFQVMLPTLISAYEHSCVGHWHQTFACLMTLTSSKLLSPFFVVLQILSKQMWNALKHFYGAFLKLYRNSNQRMVAIQKRSNLLTVSVDWLLIVQ